MAADRPDVSRVWASNSPQNIINPDTRIPNKIVTGWEAEVPPFEFFNWYQNNTDLFKLALAERGICQWGSDVTYRKGALTFFDGDGRIYIAQKLNKGQQPQIGEYWQRSAIQITEADLQALERKIDHHIESKTNPHDVQAHQIGSYTKQEIDGLFKGGTDNLDKHEKDFSNPHKVSAQQAGGVPVTGGTYTGQINTTANEMIIGKGHTDDKSSVVAVHDHVALTRGNRELGLDTTQPYYFDGTTKFRLVPEQLFAILKLFNEPKYAVPRPDFWMPLSSDINIYEGDGMVIFNRASAATYVDKQGVIKMAQPNEPRFEKEGILIEGTSTNLVSVPNIYTGLNLTSIPSVHAFAAKRLAIGGTEYIGRIIDLLVTAYSSSTINTRSAFVKFSFPDKCSQASVTSYSDGGHIHFIYDSVRDTHRIEKDGGRLSDDAYGLVQKLSDGWFRLSLSCVERHDVNSVSRCQLIPRDNLGNQLSINEYLNENIIDFAGLQLEDLPFATSYIPTNGAPATRAVDRLITSSMSVGKDSTISCDFTTVVQNTIGGTSPRVFDISTNIQPNFLGVYLDTGLNKISYYSNESGLISTEVHAPIKAKVVLVCNAQSNKVKIYINGDLIKESHCTPQIVNMPFGLGCSAVNHFGQLNGHLSNFKFWATALTTEQVSTL